MARTRPKAFQRELALGSLFVLVVSAAVIVAAVSLSGGREEDAAQRPGARPSPTAQRAASDQADQDQSVAAFMLAPTSGPVLFRGSGDHLTPIVHLLEGQVVLKMRHRGMSTFIVRLLSPDGASTVSVDTVGSYSGARLHRVRRGDGRRGLSPGPRRIEVTADGSWEVELRPAQWDAPGSGPPDRYGTAGDLPDLIEEPDEMVTPDSEEDCLPQLHC